MVQSKGKPKKKSKPIKKPYWRDEVGKSGIYPMSGPLPQGDAPLRGEMEFGQGERGAAGFFDSGGSELVFSGGQLLGGYESGTMPELPAGTPAPARRPKRAKPAPAAGRQKPGRTEKPIQSPRRGARPSTPTTKTGRKPAARKPAA